MEIKILELVEGAKQATGLTVIIDVFRAFSLECYLVNQGVSLIRPVGSLEDAFALKEAIPSSILFGERGGDRVEGADFGNSPSQCKDADLTGKTIIHSTSAGTQGIINAQGADEIITGSLVNASAIASYIRECSPEVVSLVAMGNDGVKTAPEDTLCARYIQALLEGNELDMPTEIEALKQEAPRFFDPARQEHNPTEDFYMCTDVDRFDFVLKIEHDELGLISVPTR